MIIKHQSFVKIELIIILTINYFYLKLSDKDDNIHKSVRMIDLTNSNKYGVTTHFIVFNQILKGWTKIVKYAKIT